MDHFETHSVVKEASYSRFGVKVKIRKEVMEMSQVPLSYSSRTETEPEPERDIPRHMIQDVPLQPNPTTTTFLGWRFDCVVRIRYPYLGHFPV